MVPEGGCCRPSYRHVNRADPLALASLAKTLRKAEEPGGAAPGIAPTARPVRHTGDEKVICRNTV